MQVGDTEEMSPRLIPSRHPPTVLKKEKHVSIQKSKQLFSSTCTNMQVAIQPRISTQYAATMKRLPDNVAIFA
eukprot:274396-Pleurochrysis_carterae.AAC.2